MSHTDAHIILEELWFSIAEKLFQRVCVATELDEEQIEALRAVALRPNDFQVSIDSFSNPVETHVSYNSTGKMK
jgi:hypothetical protein